MCREKKKNTSLVRFIITEYKGEVNTLVINFFVTVVTNSGLEPKQICGVL